MSDVWHTAYIGVGSNISPQENIEKALRLLQQSVIVRNSSTFYRTPPLTRSNQDDFLNGVWEIATKHTARNLKFTVLRAIETRLKRVRTEDKHAARTIDLDLLLYSDFVINEKDLSLPDKDIYDRPFIHFPLVELAPQLVLPESKIPLKKICSGKNTMISETCFTNKLRTLL